jgi:uncharacterized protein (TIGR02466 family)
MIELHALFPTPVMRVRNVLDPELCEMVYEYITEQHATSHGAMTGDAVSSHDFVSNVIPEINRACEGGIESRIVSGVNEFVRAWGQTPVRISNSWYSVQNKGSQLKQHMHSNSIISGVLYVRAEPGSNRIYFENPNRFMIYTNQVESDNEFNHEYFYFDAEPGDMLLFPSWLVHGSAYEKNQTDGRTIISFNTRYVEE